MPRESDYSRVETEIDEIDEEIEWQFGSKYAELDADDQTQVLLDHFFKGNPKYLSSARDMRTGLSAYEQGEPAEIKVGWVTRGKRQYRVIRDSKTGRIRQWVRE